MHYGYRHGRSDLAYRGAEGLNVALGGLRGHLCVRVCVRVREGGVCEGGVCVRVVCEGGVCEGVCQDVREGVCEGGV